jgi:hypothetical protein
MSTPTGNENAGERFLTPFGMTTIVDACHFEPFGMLRLNSVRNLSLSAKE